MGLTKIEITTIITIVVWENQKTRTIIQTEKITPI